ncbi:MAG: BglG family transcription antiterminator [Collinsella intestinalis]|uniref:Putative licABCH operon regulator n=1 Tax=Collinsella intestinalis TaxID=147207 RepID=A0A6N3D7H0_9ACTN
MLDGRDIKLIDIIDAHPDIDPVDLAERFSVSDRSVRTYVRKTNEALGSCAQIEKRRGGGYSLRVLNASAFAALRARDAHAGQDAVPTTPEARVDYLLNDLLSRADWITVDDLASILFVSRNVITSDLRQVAATLERFGLVLEKRPHYGIRVTGPEMSRRLCLANLTLDCIIGTGGSASLDVIARCVSESLAEEDFQINSAAYQNLLVHIAVAVERIRANCYVPMEPEHLERMRSTPEYLIAKKVAAAVERELTAELPEEEIGYIAIHLAGKQTLYTPGSDADANLVISDEVWNVVSRMLEMVWNAFHFDFRNDLELRMNLARHIVPLSVRLRYRMRIDNPLLSDIKQRFPVAYSMALESSCILAEEYGNALSEDEVGYIALAFALAIERQKSERPRKNILVVCASGQGSARLLEWRYRQEFGTWLDRIETCDVAHVASRDLTGIDYVFTTVPLERKLPVPVREVKYFLDDEDVNSVRRILSGEAAAAAPLAAYFDERLFLGALDAEDKDGALDALCARVAEVHDVPGDFRALVQRREELAQTCFGNLVAMPHPVTPVTTSTFVAVAVLNHSVSWNGQEVRAVFLVSVSSLRDQKLDAFYRGMARLLTSREAIQKLVSNPDFATLLDVIDTYSPEPEKE